jgi:hypothetical protein
MKKGFVFAIAAGMALALAPGIGSANQGSTDVVELVAERFQGTPNAPTEISGRVVAKSARCERGRRVVAFHDVLPLGPGQEDFRLGEDTTDHRGEFRLTTQFAPDKVYVVVEPKKGKGHRPKCKPHTSETVDAGAYK